MKLKYLPVVWLFLLMSSGSVYSQSENQQPLTSVSDEQATNAPMESRKIHLPEQDPSLANKSSEVSKSEHQSVNNQTEHNAMLEKGSNQMAPDKKIILNYLKQLSELNKRLSETENEQLIDQLLGEENAILEKLVTFLKTVMLDKLAVPDDTKHQVFLKARIASNEERGNDTAVERDKVKLAYYKVSYDILEYLQYLINASHSYTAINDIVKESIARLDTIRKQRKKFKIPEFDSSNRIVATLKKNSTQLNLAQDTYKDILTFVINNPEKIASSHWFQKFSLLSTIAFFNRFELLRPISYKLAPFRVDAGGIIVSLIIITLVVFCYPLVVRGLSWVVEKYLLDSIDDHTEELYRQLKRPVFALIVFFSLDLATYALLYKTEYKAAFDNFAFIFYAVIYLWLIFNVLDSFVLAHFDKLSKSNKELRKELINLGIKITKCLIIIIALSLLLNRFGISITALMSTLGIGGLAFALAAKDSLSNLLGGVTLLIDNVFSLGDWVKIGDVEGTAVQIGLRSTTIRTFDNALITIPNSVISVSSVRNWSRRAVGRRIKMHVGVTYESNMDDIRQAVEEIRAMLKANPSIANPKEKFGNKYKQFLLSSREDTQGIKSNQLVYLDGFNDFSIDILIYCFSRSVDWKEWLEVKQDLLFKIAGILKQNNLEFAYPTAVRIHKHAMDDVLEESVPGISNVDRLA